MCSNQNKLGQQNTKFLERYCKDFFKDRFDVLENHYKELIKKDVFDEDDKNEVKTFLNIQYSTNKTYNQDWFIKYITVNDKAFNYSIDDILNDGYANSIIECIYPTIEESLKTGWTKDWSVWKNNLINSTEKLYIKHLLKEYNTPTPTPTKIFKKGYEGLFYFILAKSDWDAKYPTKNISALYLWFMKYLKVSKYEFALFWNSLPYDFKINMDHSKRSASLYSTIQKNDVDNNNLDYDTHFNELKKEYELLKKQKDTDKLNL